MKKVKVIRKKPSKEKSLEQRIEILESFMEAQNKLNMARLNFEHDELKNRLRGIMPSIYNADTHNYYKEDI